MKRIIILLMSVFITLCPIISFNNFSYADTDSSPSWIYVTQQDDEPSRSVVIGVIKAYLNARGYQNIFTYTAEKAIVQWSYNNWDNFAKSKGYNGLSDLNNHIAYRYNSNGVLQFFLDNSSLEMMNQIYTAILEYYNISENSNKQIYNGEWFEDDDGNGCYIYNINQLTLNIETQNPYPTTTDRFYSYINSEGTSYRFSGLSYFLNNNYSTSESFNIKKNNNIITSYYLFKNNSETLQTVSYNSSNNTPSYTTSNSIYLKKNNFTFRDGYLTITKIDSKYYLATYLKLSYDSYNSDNPRYYSYFLNSWLLLPISPIDSAISAAQKGMNAGIVAAGKAAAITTGKEGMNALKDYIEDNDSGDDDTVIPVDEPGDVPDIPINPSLNIPVGIVNNMPINIQLPNLGDLIPDPINNIPNGFSIPGLRYKFPFCIPFDLIAVYEVLDQTPSAPHFETEINFASFNYDLVIDLEEYEPYMVHIRNYFLILYIFGLLFITPKLLKA